MGIITEAVVSNLNYSMLSINNALKCIEDAEMSLDIGFRNPFERKRKQQKIDEAKSMLNIILKECEAQMELERKYE